VFIDELLSARHQHVLFLKDIPVVTRFEVSMVVKSQVKVFCVVMPWCCGRIP
jgi:hypothetical protein